MPDLRIIVIGGGVTGHLVKLRIPSARVLDFRTNPSPMTRQYGGNYLWEPIDGVTVRSFPVITTIDGRLPSVETFENIVRYKQKVGKDEDLSPERQVDLMSQFRSHVTGYDIVEWPSTVTINYGYNVRYIDTSLKMVHAFDEKNQLLAHIPYDILISTVPLPALFDMIGMRGVPLRSRPIFVWRTPTPLDAPQSGDAWRVNYISDPDIPAYRTTDRDGERHYESLHAGGTLPSKKLSPGKIYAHTNTASYLMTLAGMDIHCFGRYARWSPDELVHQTDAMLQHFVKAHKLC